jgi:hypothetical protein
MTSRLAVFVCELRNRITRSAGKAIGSVLRRHQAVGSENREEDKVSDPRSILWAGRGGWVWGKAAWAHLGSSVRTHPFDLTTAQYQILERRTSWRP